MNRFLSFAPFRFAQLVFYVHFFVLNRFLWNNVGLYGAAMRLFYLLVFSFFLF
jgi:hypothetical protein